MPVLKLKRRCRQKPGRTDDETGSTRFEQKRGDLPRNIRSSFSAGNEELERTVIDVPVPALPDINERRPSPE